VAEVLPPDPLWPAGAILVQAVPGRRGSAGAGSAHGLTRREQEIATLLATGAGTGAIATALQLSPHTVRRHVESILRKLGIRSRAAVAVALLSA
jgi:DNA-binding NarL/FixJ family response regulator